MRHLGLLLAALLAGPVLAAPPTERERLGAQLGALEARFDAEEARCSDRFAVNACIDAVRQRRRAALADLHERELQLDDVARRQRAAERLREIEARQAAVAARPPASTPPPTLPREPAAAPFLPPAADKAVSPPVDHRAERAAEARAAARRAAAAERRRAAAAADRARIAEREASRAASGRHTAPLPLPPELAASASPR